jgi:hypothetical protein
MHGGESPGGDRGGSFVGQGLVAVAMRRTLFRSGDEEQLGEPFRSPEGNADVKRRSALSGHLRRRRWEMEV